MLEKTLESPLDCKEIQPVHPKGGQSWVFIGRIDVEAQTPMLWPPHVKSWLIGPPHAKSWLIGKDPDAGRDWGQEEKGTTEDEMAGWHHRLDGHGFGWTPGGGDEQGGLTCCDSWGHKELDTTERLNWTGNYKSDLFSFEFVFDVFSTFATSCHTTQWFAINMSIYFRIISTMDRYHLSPPKGITIFIVSVPHPVPLLPVTHLSCNWKLVPLFFSFNIFFIYLGCAGS